MVYIFSPPFEIYVDFFALTKSDTRKDYCLIHPSVATALNQTRLITSTDDAENFLAEFKDDNMEERVLQKHHLIRTLESDFNLISSNVTIDKLICVWAYVNPLN